MELVWYEYGWNGLLHMYMCMANSTEKATQTLMQATKFEITQTAEFKGRRRQWRQQQGGGGGGGEKGRGEGKGGWMHGSLPILSALLPPKREPQATATTTAMSSWSPVSSRAQCSSLLPCPPLVGGLSPSQRQGSQRDHGADGSCQPWRAQLAGAVEQTTGRGVAIEAPLAVIPAEFTSGTKVNMGLWCAHQWQTR